MTIHVVQPGESVYAIAYMYKVPMERIISDNELTDPGRLAVGQSLVIRYPLDYHIVSEQDTLSEVAAMHGLSERELFQLNPALGGNPALTSGQTIILSLTQPQTRSLAVNGRADSTIDRAVLRKTLAYLTYLTLGSAPEEQSSAAPISPADHEVIAQARAAHVAPLRAVAPITDEPTQTTLLEQLPRTLSDAGFAGVLIDFEHVLPARMASSEDFARRLADRLQTLGFFVITSGLQSAAASSPAPLYNAGITARGAPCPPAPHAPIGAARATVQHAKSALPAENILLELPTDGYDFALPCASGATPLVMGSALASWQAVTQNAAIAYDWAAQSPHYRYWKEKGEREVWFEDARSLRAKLTLAAEEALRGISVPSLMQYCPALWLVLCALYTIETKL